MEKEKEEILESIYKAAQANDDNIISILQELQHQFGYVQKDSVEWFARRSNIPEAKFYGVLTFYSQFHMSPRGKNIVTVCSGTVCHVKGSARIISKLREDLKLRGNEVTTKDGLFTLENVNCVGACSIAPVVIVNEKVYGKMSPDKMLKNLKAYKE
jgi:NADH:ubiquinone oxidoreductase subunit E